MQNLEKILGNEIRRGMVAITLFFAIIFSAILLAWHITDVTQSLGHLKKFLTQTVSNSQAFEDTLIIQRSLNDFWVSTDASQLFTQLKVSVEGRPVAEVGRGSKNFGNVSLQDSFLGFGNKRVDIDINANAFQVLKKIIALLVLLTTLSILIYRYRRQKLNSKVRQIVAPLGFEIDQLLNISKISDFKKNRSFRKDRKPHVVTELENLSVAYDQFLENYAAYSDLKEASSLFDLASQVSHDIRSPLAALNLVLRNSKELPDNKKDLAKNALDRITHIANNLLDESKRKYRSTHTTPQQQMIASVSLYSAAEAIDSIVREKQLLFSEQNNIFIRSKINEADKQLGLGIEPQDLKSMLSNIINNSVDAKQAERQLLISVELERVDDQFVKVSVIDDAGTIPDALLTSFNEGHFRSFGKENSQTSGSGLGLASAYRSVTQQGGQLKFTALNPIGTRVEITLPMTKTA